jgi:O-acetylserine/cysteine efflux transporter
MTSSRRLVLPALAASGLLWGTTVPLSKVALGWLGPAWLTCARFALAAALLMLVSRTRLRAACRPAIVVSGAVGYGGSVLLQNMGVERTSVTHAALLIGAVPVLVAVIAAVLRHSVARPVAWAGFALSMVGVAVIAGGQDAGSSIGGDALVLAAQLLSAAFTVSQARMLPGRDPVAVTAVQLMAAAVAVLPVSLLTEGLPSAAARPGPLFATLGLVLAGTVAPTTLFAFGQSKVPADIAGAFVNLEPLVGAVLGTVAFGDPLGPVQLAGGLAILAGIALSSVPAVRAMRIRQVDRPAVARVSAGSGVSVVTANAGSEAAALRLTQLGGNASATAHGRPSGTAVHRLQPGPGVPQHHPQPQSRRLPGLQPHGRQPHTAGPAHSRDAGRPPSRSARLTAKHPVRSKLADPR